MEKMEWFIRAKPLGRLVQLQHTGERVVLEVDFQTRHPDLNTLTSQATQAQRDAVVAKVSEQLRATDEHKRYRGLLDQAETLRRQAAGHRGAIAEQRGRRDRLTAEGGPGWATECRACDVEIDAQQEALAECEADARVVSEEVAKAKASVEAKAKEFANAAGSETQAQLKAERDRLLGELVAAAGPVLDRIIHAQKAVDTAVNPTACVMNLADRLVAEDSGRTGGAEAPALTPAPDGAGVNGVLVGAGAVSPTMGGSRLQQLFAAPNATGDEDDEPG